MFNRFGRMGAIMVLAGISTGLILAAVVTCFFIPKWYESTCMVEMMPQLDWQNPTKVPTADLETLKSRHFLSKVRFKTDIAAWVPLAPPTLPRTPASPNLWLNLLLGSVAGGALFATAAIPLLGRCRRKNS